MKGGRWDKKKRDMTMAGKTHKIHMCRNKRAGGAGCIGVEATRVYEALVEQAAAREEDIEIVESTCIGYCSEGPNLKIYGGAVFNAVKVEDVPDILDTLKPRRSRRRG